MCPLKVPFLQAVSELDAISIHDGKTEFDVAFQKSKSRSGSSLLQLIKKTPSPKKPQKSYLLASQDDEEDAEESMIKTSPL